jgi:hypothetical protein
VTVTDALAMGPDNRGHALGVGAPHLLIRSVTGVEGDVEVEFSYQPRPEYGLLRPLLSHVDGGVTARGGAEWLVPSSAVRLDLADSAATARITVRAGETLRFALHRSTLEEQPARIWNQDELADRLAATVDAWQSWCELHQNYDGPWRDLFAEIAARFPAADGPPEPVAVAELTARYGTRVVGPPPDTA